MAQWIKILEFPGGPAPYVDIDLDPTYSDLVPEAFLYYEIYINQDLLDTLVNNEFTLGFVEAEYPLFRMNVVKRAGSFLWWVGRDGSPALEFGTVAGNTWYVIEAHLIAGNDEAAIRIDGVETLVSPVETAIGGINYMDVSFPRFGTDADNWIGVDNLAWSENGWLRSSQGILNDLWDFEGADPLVDANINWPTPPWLAGGVGGAYISVMSGAPGPGPGPPSGAPTPTGGAIIPGSGLSGNRFFQSFPWRVIVVDGGLFSTDLASPFWDPYTLPATGSGGTITLLDRLAANRRMNVAIGKPRTFECDVPSDSPEVNITYTDIYGEPFLAEGNRLLFAFRREGDYTTDPADYPWVIKGSFVILQLEDTAESEDGRSHLTAYDPRQLLYNRRIATAAAPFTPADVPGPGGLNYGPDVKAGAIAYDVLVNADQAQGTSRIWLEPEWVENTPTIQGYFNIQQGMSVGEVWDELEQTGLVEIYLKPIFDPLVRPGYLCEAHFYSGIDGSDADGPWVRLGSENPGAVFAWDKPSRSLVGVSHLLDGTQRKNKLLFGVGQGGTQVNLVQETDSIDKYGQYWAQQWFPVQRKGQSVLKLAQGDVESSSQGRRTITISPAAERAPIPLLDYNLGDFVQVAWSRNLRQELVAAPNWSRIVEIPIEISDDALEAVSQAVVEPQTGIFPTEQIALAGPETSLAKRRSQPRSDTMGVLSPPAD